MRPWHSSKLKKAKPAGLRSQGDRIGLRDLFRQVPKDEALKDIPKEREEELKKEIARGREEITRTILTEAQKIIPHHGQRLLSIHQEGDPGRDAEPGGSGFARHFTIGRKPYALNRSAGENDGGDCEKSLQREYFLQ